MFSSHRSIIPEVATIQWLVMRVPSALFIYASKIKEERELQT
jgi:hypothetical protein